MRGVEWCRGGLKFWRHSKGVWKFGKIFPNELFSEKMAKRRGSENFGWRRSRQEWSEKFGKIFKITPPPHNDRSLREWWKSAWGGRVYVFLNWKILWHIPLAEIFGAPPLLWHFIVPISSHSAQLFWPSQLPWAQFFLHDPQILHPSHVLSDNSLRAHFFICLIEIV